MTDRITGSSLCFLTAKWIVLALRAKELTTCSDGPDISITGDNNCIRLRFDSMESAEGLLAGGGFMLIVKGNNNRVEMGNVIVRCSPILGMT